MATYAGTYAARLGKMLDGTPPVIWTLPVQAAQVFVAGEFVYRSGGYVVTCADSPTAVLGIALEDAPGVDGFVQVLVATEMTAFMLRVHHGTPANAVIEITDLGVTTYDLAHLATPGLWYIAKDVTTVDNVTIHQFVDELGVLNGLVLATVNAAVREVK